MIKHAFALVSVITRVFYLHSTALMSMFRRIYNAIMTSYHKPLPLSWNSLHFLLMGPQVPCSHLHGSTDTAIVGVHLSLSPNISWASSEHGPIIFNRALVSNIAWAHKSGPSGIFFWSFSPSLNTYCGVPVTALGAENAADPAELTQRDCGLAGLSHKGLFN